MYVNGSYVIMGLLRAGEFASVCRDETSSRTLMSCLPSFAHSRDVLEYYVACDVAIYANKSTHITAARSRAFNY